MNTGDSIETGSGWTTIDRFIREHLPIMLDMIPELKRYAGLLRSSGEIKDMHSLEAISPLLARVVEDGSAYRRHWSYGGRDFYRPGEDADAALVPISKSVFEVLDSILTDADTGDLRSEFPLVQNLVNEVVTLEIILDRYVQLRARGRE